MSSGTRAMPEGEREAATTFARARHRDLVLLHEIAVKANQVDSAREILAFAAERICRHQAWAVAHVFLFRKYPAPRLQPVASLWRCSDAPRFRNFRRLTRQSRFAVGEGMVGLVARERRPRWIENVAGASPPVRFKTSKTQQLEVQSGFLLPVVVPWEDSAVAVLEFYSAERRRPSASRVRLASGVGALLARVFERERAEHRLAQGRESAQRRIGRELHDSVSQELTGITLMAERAQEDLEREGSAVAERMRNLVQHLSSVRSRVHAMSRGLLPVEIEARGLRQALDYLAASVREMHGIECHVTCPEELDLGDVGVANHLARIVQEAIQNAVKHAQAEVIDVTVSRRGSRFTLSVTDNGVGFATKSDLNGVGLRLMRHRAAVIGAELAISSRAGQGTRVRCEWET